jgi:hypothetical protein
MHKHTEPASAATELLKRRSIRSSLTEWARHKGFEGLSTGGRFNEQGEDQSRLHRLGLLYASIPLVAGVYDVYQLRAQRLSGTSSPRKSLDWAPRSFSPDLSDAELIRRILGRVLINRDW